MPRLPSDGIFSIDNVVHRSNQRYNDAIVWQWRDDRNIWHPYTPIDGRIIEVNRAFFIQVLVILSDRS